LAFRLAAEGRRKFVRLVAKNSALQVGTDGVWQRLGNRGGLGVIFSLNINSGHIKRESWSKKENGEMSYSSPEQGEEFLGFLEGTGVARSQKGDKECALVCS